MWVQAKQLYCLVLEKRKNEEEGVRGRKIEGEGGREKKRDGKGKEKGPIKIKRNQGRWPREKRRRREEKRGIVRNKKEERGTEEETEII